MLNIPLSSPLSTLSAIRFTVPRMSTLKDRIQEAVAFSGKRPAQIARECGVTPAAVSMWMDGTTQNLRMEQLFALADATGYEARWIATGDGERTNNPGDPRKHALGTLFDHCDERGKAAVFRVAEAESRYGAEREDSRPDTSIAC